MTNPGSRNGKSILKQIVHRTMKERGFVPDFSAAAVDELAKIQKVGVRTENPMKDLQQLLWASIDNDDSQDLITQRILKTTLDGSPVQYSQAELAETAKHCTEKEDDANKATD
jgi:hypothetical protein